MNHLAKKIQGGLRLRRGIIPAFRREAGRTLRLNAMKKSGLLTIGEYTYGFHDAYFWNNETKLQIGKYCSIAEGVVFLLGGEHRTDWITTYPFSAFTDEWPSAQFMKGHPATKGDIVIGNDVWIGHGAVILSGVNVGNGAVIGAGSVLTKNVEPYAIFAGNPAQFIRYRFDETTRESLKKLEWWDWPHQKVITHMAKLMSPPNSVDLFSEL